MKTLRVAIVSVFAMCQFAYAQQQAPASGEAQGRVIEEVIVTANKTEQSVQDVAGSVQALTGDFMQKANLNDFSDIAKYVPNTTLADNGVEPEIAIRGVQSVAAIGGGDNSVGLVIDDLALARQTFFHLGFFDLERIETLRGPQGTLFGKSTTAGVINLITAAPTDEFSGFISLRHGEEDQQFSGAVSGPLTDTLSGRLSVLVDRPGSRFENTFNGDDVGFIDRTVWRTKLRWTPSDSTEFNIFFYEVDVDHTSVNEPLTSLSQADRDFMSQYDPNIEDNAFDGKQSFDFVDHTTIDNARLYGVRMDNDWGSPLLFENLSTTLILGGADMLIDAPQDLDVSPADVFRVPEALENIRMRQLEARLQGLTPGFFSLGGGETEFVSGIFLQDERVNYDYRIVGGDDTVAYLGSPAGLQVLGVPGIGGGLCPTCGLPDLSGITSLAGDGVAVFPEMKTIAQGYFTQMIYRPVPRLAITAGLRYDRVDRDAFMPVRKLHPSGEGDASVLAPALGAEEDVTMEPEMRERELSGKLSLQYEFFDGDVVSYATYSRGFKGGAFNFFALNEESTLQVEPEFAELYEIGLKNVLFDQTLQLNVSLYRSDFTDLHVYVRTDDGVIPFLSLANAAEARAQGVEIDGMYLPASLPWLTLSGSFAYNDATYQDYPGGGPNGENLAGETLTNAPELSGVFTPEIALPLHWMGEGGVISLAVDALYTDSFFTDPGYRPANEHEAQWIFNGRLSLMPASESWSLMLSVTNLTDEKYFSLKSGYGSSIWPDSEFGRAADRRHASLDFSWNW